MARKRVTLKKIKDIIKLKHTTELSDRQIASALQVSRPLVKKYWDAFKQSGIDYAQLETVADSVLLKALEGPVVKIDRKYQNLLERFPDYFKELKRTGVTLQLLWEEYYQQNPDGYKYSQFCYHYQVWRKASELVMHMDHKAGDKMFVDYAGDRLHLTDPVTGHKTPVETFVAILGASGYTYVETSPSQQNEDWVRSNERALIFFAGVPAAIIPDNLKSAVTKSDPYEPGINTLYDDFADFYGTAIIPGRVRKARDKALVENAVRLVYQRIYAPLRNMVFHNLQQLNEAIWEKLELHNARQFQRLKISRKELFEEVEHKALKALPPEKFPNRTTLYATVQSSYHIEIREDRHYYSVPFILRKVNKVTKVKVVYDNRIVSIYYDNVRIAQHNRDRTPNGYTTKAEHMPPNHKFYAEWSPEKIRQWADAYGQDVRQVIDRMLESRKHPEQAFKSCLGLLSLGKKYNSHYLVRACHRANEYKISSLTRIQRIIEQIRQEETQPELDWGNPLPEHENIRGSEYYN